MNLPELKNEHGRKEGEMRVWRMCVWLSGGDGRRRRERTRTQHDREDRREEGGRSSNRRRRSSLHEIYWLQQRWYRSL